MKLYIHILEWEPESKRKRAVFAVGICSVNKLPTQALVDGDGDWTGSRCVDTGNLCVVVLFEKNTNKQRKIHHLSDPRNT